MVRLPALRFGAAGQAAGTDVGKEWRPRPGAGAAAVPPLDERVSSVPDEVIEQRKV